MAISLDLSQLPAITNDAYWPLYGAEERNIICKGGGGSGKSRFIAQQFVVRMMLEPGHHIAGFRKVAKTCRTSIFAEMLAAIDQLGAGPLWRAQTSDLTLKFLPNGNIFRCLGMDDSEKLKSIVGLTSAWMEEATEFIEPDYEQINLRLRGQFAYKKQIWQSFNPISVMHWIKDHFFDQPQHSTRTLSTTFQDNRFLDPEYIAELRQLETRNPQLWKVYGLGEWGALEGLIFPIWANHDDWAGIKGEVIRGLDFGYNDPCALIACKLKDRRVYLREEIYESGLITSSLIKRMDALGVPKRQPIYADSAEPDRIEEIQRAGYNIWPADKRPGSLGAGIDFMQGLEIYSMSSNTNIAKENMCYAWAVDKNGRKLDEPIDFFNHAIDATRYALFTHLFHVWGSALQLGRFRKAA